MVIFCFGQCTRSYRTLLLLLVEWPNEAIMQNRSTLLTQNGLDRLPLNGRGHHWWKRDIVYVIGRDETGTGSKIR